jgi:site-specific DNA-methyltransferase (adenine-specific)
MLENFRNKVFNEDVLKVLKSLPNNSLDMIYGDPDYNVGINYAGKKLHAKME